MLDVSPVRFVTLADDRRVRFISDDAHRRRASRSTRGARRTRAVQGSDIDALRARLCRARRPAEPDPQPFAIPYGRILPGLPMPAARTRRCRSTTSAARLLQGEAATLLGQRARCRPRRRRSSPGITDLVAAPAARRDARCSRAGAVHGGARAARRWRCRPTRAPIRQCRAVDRLSRGGTLSALATARCSTTKAPASPTSSPRRGSSGSPRAVVRRWRAATVRRWRSERFGDVSWSQPGLSPVSPA